MTSYTARDVAGDNFASSRCHPHICLTLDAPPTRQVPFCKCFLHVPLGCCSRATFFRQRRRSTSSPCAPPAPLPPRFMPLHRISVLPLTTTAAVRRCACAWRRRRCPWRWRRCRWRPACSCAAPAAVRAAVRACARSRRDLCVQMDQLLVVIGPITVPITVVRPITVRPPTSYSE